MYDKQALNDEVVNLNEAFAKLCLTIDYEGREAQVPFLYVSP